MAEFMLQIRRASVERSGSSPNLAAVQAPSLGGGAGALPPVVEALPSRAKEEEDRERSEESESATISDEEGAAAVPHCGGRGVGDFGEVDSGRKRRGKQVKGKEAKKAKPKPVPLRPLLPGEVVWAKIPSYPWWPAQVADNPTEAHLAIRHKKTDLFVVFFGDDGNQCSWLPREKLDPWRCEGYAERVGKRTKGLQEAVRAALDAIAAVSAPGDDAERPAQLPA